MKKIIIPLIVAFFVYTIFFKTSSDFENFQSLPKDTKILAFGDSLTYGTGATKGKSYPEQLSIILNVNIIKEGIPGEVSENGLKRLPKLLDKYKPHILLLCHGGNDILRRKNLDNTKKNIKQMITLAQSKGIKVILIGVPAWEGVFISTAKMYNELAQEMNIAYEGKSMETIINDGSLKSDNIHPNDKGYTLMAKSIANVIYKNYP